MMRQVLILVLVGLVLHIPGVQCKESFKSLYGEAVKYLDANDYQNSMELLHQAIAIKPNDLEANQLLGSLMSSLGDNTNGVIYLKKASDLDNFKNPTLISNFIEALRGTGQYEEAIRIGTQGIELHPNDATIPYNLGNVYAHARDWASAQKQFLAAVQISPRKLDVWKKLVDAMLNLRMPEQAEAFVDQALASQFFSPKEPDLLFLKALCRHSNDRLVEALDVYREVVEIDPGNHMAWANLAAVYQSLGLVKEAQQHYEQVLEHFLESPGILNNYGALLGVIGRKDEELHWLSKSYALDPTIEHTCMNLGSFYQDDGDIEEAIYYFEQAKKVTSGSPSLIDLRISLILSPLPVSWGHSLAERSRMEARVKELLAASNECRRGDGRPCSIVPSVLDSSLDRVHFYLVYHGLNDRFLQEMIVECYRRILGDFGLTLSGIPASVHDWQLGIKHRLAHAGNTLPKPNMKPKPGRLQLQAKPEAEAAVASGVHGGSRVRVGFISKFFGIFEPHGLLLDGVMKYMPKDLFEIILLEVARTDGKPLPASLASAVQESFTIPLNHNAAMELIAGRQLDILIFADTMCEPMNHFLAHNRMAPVQMAFWGNPVTSASTAIDYFISADVMEHPFRTRMPVQDDPYSEQVVLLEGQGIWYFAPITAKEEVNRANFHVEGWVVSEENYTKAEFGFSEDWFIFFCPQSVFKIHPLFDLVMRDILRGHPNAHVVLTAGRKPKWSDNYSSRLKRSLNDPELSARLHIIERVSSERFIHLLNIADVLLHPFPFDGSKTSADGLYGHVPLVTLPTESLRGRMGQAFLRTMNLPELVARDRDDYVAKCLALLKDPALLASVKQRIRERVGLIWEDMEYAHSWTNMLIKAAGIELPASGGGSATTGTMSWEDFVRQSGRDVAKETKLRDLRRENARLFKEQYGNEDWLLENGVARLESMLFSDDSTASGGVLPVPKIFNNWKSSLFSAPTQNYTTVDHYISSVYSEFMQSHLHLTPGTDDAMWRARLSGQLETASSRSNAHPSKQSAPTTVKVRLPAPISTPLPEETYAQFKTMCLTGKIDEAHVLLASLYTKYHNHPHYLMDLGLTEFFRGNYQNAFDFCVASGNILKTMAKEDPLAVESLNVREYYESGILLSCRGLSGTYMNLNSGLELVLRAWKYTNLYSSDILISETFGLPHEALDLNLVGAYRNAGEMKQCWNVVLKSYSKNLFLNSAVESSKPPKANLIRSDHEFNAYLLVFSFVQWSPAKYDLLALLGDTLIHHPTEVGAATGLTKHWFAEEIARVQQEYTHIMNVAIDCLMQSDRVLLSRIVQEMTNIVHALPHSSRAFPPYTEVPSSFLHHTPALYNCPENSIALIAQFYSSLDPAAEHSMSAALLKNLHNPCVKDIYMLTEEEIDFSLFPPSASGTDIGGEKLHQVVIGKRLSFYDAIHFANTHLVGRIVIIGEFSV